jgi:hypothetical protein
MQLEAHFSNFCSGWGRRKFPLLSNPHQHCVTLSPSAPSQGSIANSGMALKLQDMMHFGGSDLNFRGLSTHTQNHTQTMAHRHHHPPLSRRSVNGHVLCAVATAVARSSPSLMSPLLVLSPLVAIALFVAVAVPVTIALFSAHRCAPSPPTVLRICSDGGIGSSLAAAEVAVEAKAWRRR